MAGEGPDRVAMIEELGKRLPDRCPLAAALPTVTMADPATSGAGRCPGDGEG